MSISPLNPVDGVRGPRPSEGVLAWDLVEHVRDRLTDAERHTVFVHLGVGDYPPVFGCVLEAVARERLSLPPQMVALLHAWIEDYDQYRGFAAMLHSAVGEASA